MLYLLCTEQTKYGLKKVSTKYNKTISSYLIMLCWALGEAVSERQRPLIN